MSMNPLLTNITPGHNMLTLAQITFVMQSLQNIANDVLEKEKNYLFTVLDMLIESFCYAEIPSVRPDESAVLQDFIAWLLSLSENPDYHDDRLALVAYSETLSATMQAKR